MRLSYFIFTSGEQGNYGEDWGVKFCSPPLDIYAVDDEYRRLTESFSLSPGIVRPRDGEVGAVILPWSGENKLLGFVLPYKDMVGRLNISLVAVLVDGATIKEAKTLQNLMYSIWSQYDITDISKREPERKSKVRPNFLNIEPNGEKQEGSVAMNGVASVNFPKWDDIGGFVCVNKNWNSYARKYIPPVNEEEQSKPKSRKKWLIAAIVMLLFSITIPLGRYLLRVEIDIEKSGQPKVAPAPTSKTQNDNEEQERKISEIDNRRAELEKRIDGKVETELKKYGTPSYIRIISTNDRLDSQTIRVADKKVVNELNSIKDIRGINSLPDNIVIINAKDSEKKFTELLPSQIIEIIGSKEITKGFDVEGHDASDGVKKRLKEFVDNIVSEGNGDIGGESVEIIKKKIIEAMAEEKFDPKNDDFAFFFGEESDGWLRLLPIISGKGVQDEKIYILDDSVAKKIDRRKLEEILGDYKKVDSPYISNRNERLEFRFKGNYGLKEDKEEVARLFWNEILEASEIK